MPELSKQFNFKEVDEKWSKYWEDQNVFHAEPNADKAPYTIVIPPPNVTGILHMGHALNNTLQDIIIRYKRMKGYEALWMPGTDHAGIATQNVVERQLAKEGKTRQDIGREYFIKKSWEWKTQYGDTIIHQLKKLGASCDWERARFTMDQAYSDAVTSAFVELYKKKLIYQGNRIINWCPRCQTALSDEEAEHRETQGHLYHIRYPFKDRRADIIVATTRPETMLGDTAVAVNPTDKRYKDYIGKTLILPLLGREVSVIGDEFVDPKFGTGAVKVTPAHDPNDFDMGRRHNLAFVNIMRPDARLNQEAGEFEGMDRFEAREAVVETLRKTGALVKVEPHTHAVGHCYRCHTVVEPYLSKQWFVKMKPLAGPAIRAVAEGKITFHPKRWTKVYMNWMENIRDWCISRQIWWGHRIPVWYCVGDEQCHLSCKEPIVSETAPECCPRCGSKNIKQDDDVLDTWFSSWLWPFATFDWPNFNWPKNDKDFKYFYPTNSLFTASEIIFFWVARMIMAGYEFTGQAPFRDVYIHGTVRDAQGRKMSKSLGNALDPLEIIEEYGADALRFSLIINSGQDLFISKEKFEVGRNFANKMWNASRLVLMNTPGIDPAFDLTSLKKMKNLDLPSKWIVSRFYTTLKNVGASIERFRYSEAEGLIYEFFWGNFCDWYLEIIKDRWADTTTQNIAFKILEQSLKMVHPFMPFVTEEIWSRCHEGRGPISREPWPAYEKQLTSHVIETQMQTIIEVVGAVRNARAQWNIKSAERVRCYLSSESEGDLELLRDNEPMLKNLARIESLTVGRQPSEQKNTAAFLVNRIKGAVPLGDLIDVEAEKTRITAEVEGLKKTLQGLAGRLENKNFTDKAPREIVEKERARLVSARTKVEELESLLAGLENK